MTFPLNLMSRPCVVVTVSPDGGHDEGNNPTFVETRTPTRCYLEQMMRGSAESTSAEDIATERWKWYGPPGVPVSASSIIEVDGNRLAVEGSPFRGYNPTTGAVDYIEVTATQTRVAQDEPVGS